MSDIATINREDLQTRMALHAPDNDDPREGFALVNVLDPEQFDKKHIPQSINIPGDELDEFERRFAKTKKIVVYCASFDCKASPKAASALEERGFQNVIDYAGGMNDWVQAGNPTAGLNGSLH